MVTKNLIYVLYRIIKNVFVQVCYQITMRNILCNINISFFGIASETSNFPRFEFLINFYFISFFTFVFNFFNLFFGNVTELFRVEFL